MVLAYQLAVQRPVLAVMWIFGLAFGVILQRSRFCFASAFRDLYTIPRQTERLDFRLHVEDVGPSEWVLTIWK